MKKAVVIDCAEILTPFGRLHETVAALSSGASALRPGPLFDVPAAYAPFQDTRHRNLRAAADHLASHVNLKNVDRKSTIFISCSAKGDIHSLEEFVTGNTRDIDVSPLVDGQANEACKLLGLSPARMLCISNACASGAIAVEVAKELLEDQMYSSAVIFGIDSLCRFVATGFHALSALSPTGARPFDAARDGLSLGEATAVAVLSCRQPQQQDTIIAGAGSSNDANHRTGPSRTGEGLYRAAQAALTDASASTAFVGAVKCHGTATPYNDAMEAKAIHRLFGDTCPPCASFKGALGHTSGTGSLVELLIAAQCLKNRQLPPTAGYRRHGVDEQIPVSGTVQPIGKPSVLCLSAGFGGVNAAVLLSEAL